MSAESAGTVLPTRAERPGAAARAPAPAPGAERVARLRRAYAKILDAHREIERLSRRVRTVLRDGGDPATVRDILRRKRSLLAEIHREEKGVSSDRDWWRRSRRSLPPATSGDVLSLLETIARTIESTVLAEAECRGLLLARIPLRRTGDSGPAPLA